jgi:hypothetical protein
LEACIPWLSTLGASLQRTNSAIARALRRGDIAGPALDEKIVSIEQSQVERSLLLAQSRSFYPQLLVELDTLLNEHIVIAALHFSAVVRWYGRVLASVRAELQAPIAFDRQIHREKIGLALIRAL